MISFTARANFDGLVVEGDCAFDSAQGGVPAFFGGDASFINAHLAGDARFTGVCFDQQAQFDGVQVDGEFHFDEVDVGIGGRVAEIVGRMLRKLGRRHQVMCVTHLPQVAASADQQWQVTKTVAAGKVMSRVTPLDASQRLEEIARMLGGLKITETTRRHAAEMLGVKE